MAVRTAYVGTEAAGDVLTAANFNKLPGGLIGYAIVTANQTGISTATNLTSLTVTVTVNTSRIIMIDAIGVMGQNSSTGLGNLTIYEGATQLANSVCTMTAAGFWTGRPLCVLSATSGAHTYNLKASTNAGTIDLIASATQPATLTVYDMGPNF